MNIVKLEVAYEVLERANENKNSVQKTMKQLNFSRTQIQSISNVCLGLISMKPKDNSELMSRADKDKFDYRNQRKKMTQSFVKKIRNMQRQQLFRQMRAKLLQSAEQEEVTAEGNAGNGNLNHQGENEQKKESAQEEPPKEELFLADISPVEVTNSKENYDFLDGLDLNSLFGQDEGNDQEEEDEKIEKIRLENEEIAKKYQQKQKDCQIFKRKNEDLTKENKKVLKDCSKLEKVNEKLNSQLWEKKRQCNQLKKDIEQMKRKNEELELKMKNAEEYKRKFVHWSKLIQGESNK